MTRHQPTARAGTASPRRHLRIAGIFAGIGGIELGLRRAGHKAAYLCENEAAAVAVLCDHFPEALVVGDVRELHQAGDDIGLLTAGFPCQDLSQAGLTAGIHGTRSGIVEEVFRLLVQEPGPEWVLLENVPFMLQLDNGQAMRHVVARLADLGYRWAYRVVDARAFGVPQRRQRVLLLASRRHDPRSVLLGQDLGERRFAPRVPVAYGFYWTEGLRGLGWAVDAVPTLKGGSTIGIVSAPAIWRPDGSIGTPDIRDGERLQGFPEDWTLAASNIRRGAGTRWKLVGNAVNVRVAEWLGECLARPRGRYHADRVEPLRAGDRLPLAAWGAPGGPIVPAGASAWPKRERYEHLEAFLKYPLKPLSARATAGFLSRADQKKLRFDEAFLHALRRHLRAMEEATMAA